jgi:hypothetical protein
VERAHARSSWLAGLVLGAGGGFLLVEFPTAGLVIVVGALVIVARAGRALPGLGGLLIGIGAVWIALFGRIKLTCTAETGCFAPSIDTYVAASIALFVTGLTLSGLALARARRP